MQPIEKVLNWLLMSSNNPEEVSLTVKGMLINAIPVIMFIAGLSHINLGQDTLTAIFNNVSIFVQAVLLVVGTGATLYGALRKVWLTIVKPSTDFSTFSHE